MAKKYLDVNYDALRTLLGYPLAPAVEGNVFIEDLGLYVDKSPKMTELRETFFNTTYNMDAVEATYVAELSSIPAAYIIYSAFVSANNIVIEATSKIVPLYFDLLYDLAAAIPATDIP